MSKVSYLNEAEYGEIIDSPVNRLGQLKQNIKKDIENYKKGLVLYLIRGTSEDKELHTLKRFNIPSLVKGDNSPKGKIYNYISYSEVPKKITDMYICIDIVNVKTNFENNGVSGTVYIDIIYHPKFDLFLLKDNNKVYARTDIIFSAIQDIVKNNKDTDNTKGYLFRTHSVTEVEMYKQIYNGTAEIDGFMLQRIMFDISVL